MPVNIIANDEKGGRACRRYRRRACKKKRYCKQSKRRYRRRSKKSKKQKKESGLFYTSSKLRGEEVAKIVRHLQRIAGATAYCVGVCDSDAVSSFSNTPALDTYLKAKAYFAKHPRRLARAAGATYADLSKIANAGGGLDVTYGACFECANKLLGNYGFHPGVDLYGQVAHRVMEHGGNVTEMETAADSSYRRRVIPGEVAAAAAAAAADAGAGAPTADPLALLAAAAAGAPAVQADAASWPAPPVQDLFPPAGSSRKRARQSDD